MSKIYYIGGSPCSGKSTVAEILARTYHLYYFKVDDYLEKYMQEGALQGCEICKKVSGMSPEEIWMRDPATQCIEELQIYREIFPFILKDLSDLQEERDIITEGAAFLPELMYWTGVNGSEYISVTPSKEFQIEHYSKREWVPYVLEGCSDKELAFRNWMDRDVLFAENVRKQCEDYQYKSILNDGSRTVGELLNMVQIHFGLERAAE